MRMWMVDPRGMCRRHLLGEHVELHMIVGSVEKDRALDGFVSRNCLELRSVGTRHEELVEEMLHRGYNHQSPMQRYLRFNQTEAVLFSKVDRKAALAELHRRCPECRSRFRALI